MTSPLSSTSRSARAVSPFIVAREDRHACETKLSGQSDKSKGRGDVPGPAIHALPPDQTRQYSFGNHGQRKRNSSDDHQLWEGEGSETDELAGYEPTGCQQNRDLEENRRSLPKPGSHPKDAGHAHGKGKGKDDHKVRKPSGNDGSVPRNDEPCRHANRVVAPCNERKAVRTFHRRGPVNLALMQQPGPGNARRPRAGAARAQSRPGRCPRPRSLSPEACRSWRPSRAFR